MGYQYYMLINVVLTVILGIFITSKLKQLNLEQKIRDDVPVAHLKKQGTPSMGGLIFLIPTILISIIYLPHTLLPFLALLGYALIGIYDDLDKRVINKSGGLSIKKKLILEIIIGTVTSLVALLFLKSNLIGFTKNIVFELHPLIYIVFIIIFLISVTNGLNFTDGLDGLATMVTIPVFVLFIFISLDQGNIVMAKFSGMILASLVGFLFFNFYPAKIFMGDTGSLALGALVAAIAIMLNVEILILFFGFIYFVEALSVIIQIVYFKTTKGKRFFKMAPLHHHFELSGWRETKTVLVFTLVSTIMSLLAYFIYLNF